MTRKSLALRTLLFVVASGVYTLASAQCDFGGLSDALRARPDDASHRAADNLNHLCSVVRMGDVKDSAAARKCLGSSTQIFSESDTAILQKSLGGISSATLRALVPAIGAFLNRPTAGAIAAMLIAEPLGRDAFDVLGHPEREARGDLNKAARQLIWTTEPAAFRDHISTANKAAVTACLVAQ